MTPQLDMKLFGSPQFVYKDQSLAASLPKKARALLIYLAVTGRTHSRDALAELLWADTPETKRDNLKKALNNLRKMEGVSLIEEGYLNVTLAPDSFKLDVNEFSTIARQNLLENITTIERAVTLYQDDFLIGFNLSLSLEFEGWALGIQSQLKMQMLELLHQLADGYEQQNLLPNAIATLRQILQIEPWQEEYHRRLIERLAQNGDAGAALAHYEICCQNLRAELDVDPSPATTDLVEQIRNGTFAPQPLPRKTYQPSNPGLHPLGIRLSKTKVEYPLVGREGEWQIVRTAWESLTQSHFVCIGGEAGIGKTRLAEELLLLAESQNASVARTRSHELQGQLAFGPITDWLRSAPLQFALGKLDDGWRLEISRLLPELLNDGTTPPQPMQEGWQRKRFFDALVHAFTAIDGPLLLVLDDLQWSDTDTLEWIQYLVESCDGPLLIVGTIRINEIHADHPLHRLRHQLRRQDKFTEIELSELTVEATNRLAATVIESNLEEQFAQQLFNDTAGNPLFVIESMRAGPDESVITEPMRVEPSFSADPQSESDNLSVSIPAKIYSVIQARLAQLSPQAQLLAQFGAAMGRAFDAKLLAKAAQSDENEVLILLDELWQQRIIKEVDVVHFDFSHDRIRDVAYAEIRPIQLRMLHRRVADAMEVIHSKNLERIYGQLATHFQYAGLIEKAITYYQRAAQVANGLNAYREKIKCLTEGLSLIQKLPNRVEFINQELTMLREQSDSYMALEGYASKSAEKLCEQMLELAYLEKDSLARYFAFYGLRAICIARGDLYQATKYSTNLLEIAEGLGESEHLADANNLLASTYFHMGQLDLAWPHYRKAIAFEWPSAFLRSAHPTWLLGYPDQARKNATQAIRAMRNNADPYNISWALLFAAMLDFLLQNFDLMEERYQEAYKLGLDYDLAFILAHSHFFRGWLLVKNDEVSQAKRAFQLGKREREVLDNKLFQPLWNCIVIDAYIRAHRNAEAYVIVTETLNETNISGEAFLDAELVRLRGFLSLQNEESIEIVEEQYLQAINIAKRQSAKLLELRATISLCRLWQTQSKQAEAHQALSEIYGWFTEGFDTKDLVEAKTLLEQLGGYDKGIKYDQRTNGSGC